MNKITLKRYKAYQKALNDYYVSLEPKKTKVISQVIKDKYSIYHGDSIEVIKGLPNDSIHYSIFSPPFSSLFTYSASERDLGNSNEDDFYFHFDYLIPQLYRILKPGRCISIHCSDIPAMKERDGYIGLKDFPGEILNAFQKYGFIYHSKHIIWKDPLIEATRTKALGLMHKQIVKDSAICRAGLPDYIITVRKPGENKERISHPNGFEQFFGENEPKNAKNKDQMKNKYSHYVWQKYASPVWMDINQTNTLNVKQARDKDDERHICPLQLDVINRCLELWSNPDEIILSPFMGIGSEGYCSVHLGRKFIGIELKDSYFKVSKKNLKSAASNKQISLGID